MFAQAGHVVNVFAAATADSASRPIRSLAGDSTGLCGPRDIAVDPAGRLHVMSGNVVTVYQAGAAGNAVPIRAISVPRTGNNPALGMAVDRRGYIYVGTDDSGIADSGSIAVFPPGATEDQSPQRLLRGARTSLRRPRSVAVDDEGLIYATTTGDSVLVFSPGSNGDVVPLRVIAGDSTGLKDPAGLALDRRGFLYVANTNGKSVTVYRPGSAGNARPVRVIESDSFATSGPTMLAVDRHDTLYVATKRNVLVYAPAAEASPAVVRSIRLYGIRSLAVARDGRLAAALEMGEVWIFGPGATAEAQVAGKLRRGDSAFDPSGVAFGPEDSLFVADARGNAVRVYAPGATNDTTPARRVAGPKAALSDPFGIAVDRRGRLYVTNAPLPKTIGAIRVFAPTADGDAPLVREINGPSAALIQPMDVALDSRGDIYVLNWGDGYEEWRVDRINVFRADANGDVAPTRTIKGPNTLLRHPIKFAFGANDTLYVLNAFHLWKYGTGNVTVTVYAPGVSGDIEPVRSIIVTGGRPNAARGQGLIWPSGIAVDARGAVYLANYFSKGGVAVFAPGANGPAKPERFVYPRSAVSTMTWPGMGAVAVAIGPRDELFVAGSPQPTEFTMR
jgi:sugar lactone lactonase YvrE